MLFRASRFVAAAVLGAVALQAPAIASASAGTPSAAPAAPVVVAAIFDANGAAHPGGLVVRRYETSGNSAAHTLIDQLDNRDDVVSAQVDHRVQASDITAQSTNDLEIQSTNDTLRSQQWGVDAVHAEPAWASSTGTGQIVAVVDTGTDATHPDLAGQVLPGADFTVSADGSGGNGTHDDNGHGTHVSGIIAAIANNGIGVAGVAPNARILPVKALDASGSGWSSDIASGVIWAADHGATVISLSLGSSYDDPSLRSAIAYAHDVRHANVVAAAGNSGQQGNPVFYPGADPGVIAVAATGSAGDHPSFSESGSFVDIAAPGVGILSTWPVASPVLQPGAAPYLYSSGTSMATPFVSAAAALVRSRYGATDPDAVEARLEASSLDLGTAGRDDLFGAGQLDAAAAVCAPTLALAAPTAPAATLGGAATGTTVQVSWTQPACTGGSRNVSYSVTASAASGTVTASVANATSLTLTGLQPGTTYNVTVVASNSAGASGPGTPVTVATTGGSTPAPSTGGPAPTTPPTTNPAPSTSPTTNPAPSTTPGTPSGYWVAASDGAVAAFGSASSVASNGAMALNQPVVGMAATASRRGYWLVARDGGIFSFGDAAFLGSTGSIRLNQPIVGMTTTPTGQGYWFVAADGGIFAFGDAGFFGSTGSLHLNQPIVGMAATPTGRGYWLVARDGGIFAFGDAAFYGSTGAIRLNQPIVGMASTTTGRGYWFVAADGGIFSFGDARFLGSTGGATTRPIVGMATADANGYWLVDADGHVFPFGDAPYYGTAALGATATGIAS